MLALKRYIKMSHSCSGPHRPAFRPLGPTDCCASMFNPLTHRDTFYHFCRADPDPAALVRAVWSGSTLFAFGNMVDLTSNLFAPCKNMKFIHSGWSLAWMFMKERAKELLYTYGVSVKISRIGSWIILATTSLNLSSGFLTKRDSYQSPQIQRLARKLKFRLKQV